MDTSYLQHEKFSMNKIHIAWPYFQIQTRKRRVELSIFRVKDFWRKFKLELDTFGEIEVSQILEVKLIEDL